MRRLLAVLVFLWAAPVFAQGFNNNCDVGGFGCFGAPGGFAGNNNAPTIQFNFLNGQGLDSRITFSRASSGTYFSADGLLQTATSNVARFDFANGSPRGLLLEQARTNEALQNRDLTNAAWTKSSATALKNQTGIDGASNGASSLSATGSNGTACQTITSASNTARRFSVYVKRLVGSGGVDLSMDNGVGWTSVTVTSSYTRVAMGQTLADPTVCVRLQTSGDSVALDYAQEEVGSSDTSPILTAGSTVARAPDNAFVNITAVTAATLYVWGENQATSTPNDQPYLRLDDGTSNNSGNLGRRNSSGGTRWRVNNGAVDQADISTGTWTANTTARAIGAFATNDFAASLNGGAVGTDASGTPPSVNRILLGGIADNSEWLRVVEYYNRRMPNSFLIQRTGVGNTL